MTHSTPKDEGSTLTPQAPRAPAAEALGTPSEKAIYGQYTDEDGWITGKIAPDPNAPASPAQDIGDRDGYEDGRIRGIAHAVEGAAASTVGSIETGTTTHPHPIDGDALPVQDDPEGSFGPGGIDGAIAAAEEAEARAAEAARALAKTAASTHSVQHSSTHATAPPPTPRTPHSYTLGSNPKSTPWRSGNSQGGTRGHG